MSELMELLAKLRYDTTAMQVKIGEAMRMVGALPDDAGSKVRCPECGVPLAGPRSLADHVHVSHGGPVPEYELVLESMIEEEAL